MILSVIIWGFADFGNELQNITYLPTNFEMELTILSEMSSTKSICVVIINQYKRRRFKDLDGETTTENVTPTEQVAKSDKTNKKSKGKKKAIDSLKTQKNDSPTNI